MHLGKEAMENISTKACSDCTQILPFSEFYRCKFGKFGLLRPCKTCMIKRAQRRHARAKQETTRAYPNKVTDRHLYIVLREGFQGFKIGQSKNVRQRMRGLKHKYGCNILPFAVFENLGFLESDLHFALRQFRIKGTTKDRELYDAPIILALEKIHELMAS